MAEMPLFKIARVQVSVSVWIIIPVMLAISWMPSVLTELAVIFAYILSILVHEMGHALVARHFHLEPRVVIHGIGGVCYARPARTDRQDLLVTAAGPLAGLCLGGLAYTATILLEMLAPQAMQDHLWLAVFMDVMLTMNIIWSLLNLLPIRPLDGGEIFNILMRRARPTGEAHRLVHQVGIACAASGAFYALFTHQPIITLLAIHLAFVNWRLLQAPPEPHTRPPEPTARRGTPGGRLGSIPSVPPTTKQVAFVMIASWAFLMLSAVIAAQPWALQMYKALMLSPDLWLSEPWTAFTYLWLHDVHSIGHVAMNTLGFVFLGAILEPRWGRRDFLKFFLISGVISGAITAGLGLLFPAAFGTPVVGASGGVFALLTALGLVMPEREVQLFFTWRLKLKHCVLGAIACDTIYFVLTPDSDIAWHTHMAGAFSAWILVTGNWRPQLIWARARAWQLKRRRKGFHVIDGGDRSRTLH